MENKNQKFANRNDAEKPSVSDRIGDVVEKAGHKISEAGAPKMGQKIHDLGDKMEKHHKNPNHPHKA